MVGEIISGRGEGFNHANLNTLLLISGMASTYPEPEDKGAFIKYQLYDTEYRPAIPTTYSWPQN